MEVASGDRASLVKLRLAELEDKRKASLAVLAAQREANHAMEATERERMRRLNEYRNARLHVKTTLSKDLLGLPTEFEAALAAYLRGERELVCISCSRSIVLGHRIGMPAPCRVYLTPSARRFTLSV